MVVGVTAPNIVTVLLTADLRLLFLLSSTSDIQFDVFMKDFSDMSLLNFHDP